MDSRLLCTTCQTPLIRQSRAGLICPNGCGKLIPMTCTEQRQIRKADAKKQRDREYDTWRVSLPKAMLAGVWGLWWISEQPGLWRRVQSAGKSTKAIEGRIIADGPSGIGLFERAVEAEKRLREIVARLETP